MRSHRALVNILFSPYNEKIMKIQFHKTDLTLLLLLTIPLILSSLTEASLGFTSTIFLAHLGPKVLGAGSLVIWFFATLMVIIWGLMTAVSVLISRHHGAGDTLKASRALHTALWLTLFLCLPLTLIVWNMAEILTWLGQSPHVVNLAKPYLHALAFGVLPDLSGLVCLQFLIGLGKTRVSLAFTLCWVPLNIFFNAILTFGLLGLPALGIGGLGLGATLSYWITTLGLLIYLLRHREFRHYFKNGHVIPAWQDFRQILAVGLPLGLMFFVEVGFFFILTLMMGFYGADALAANQVAVQSISLFAALMFPIAQGITVRMGHQLGAQDSPSAHRSAMAGITLAISVSLIFALIGWFVPELFVRLDFGSHAVLPPEILMHITHFLIWAGVFQLFESQRIALFGALRALKDTRFTLFTSILSFWGIGLGSGLLLRHLLGAQGYWAGFALGGMTGALLLWFRYAHQYHKYQKRIHAPSSISGSH